MHSGGNLILLTLDGLGHFSTVGLYNYQATVRDKPTSEVNRTPRGFGMWSRPTAALEVEVYKKQTR